ncbi:MAG: TlyA family rRNA (cytidine-2'-O)-methyltransferase [Phycisphaerae bacterium]|nr:TlyA family rRNA (cytidine-2'-O)-methyltransferase [Phycisphaerae bacterium]
MSSSGPRYVGRAGEKLAAALSAFGIDPTGRCCADLGSSTGGFVDCLLQAGASRVYAVERGYGVIDLRLRNDPRAIVMERTNALAVRLPEPVDLVTIDAGWTRQRRILPVAVRLVKSGGDVISLVKPHYEADSKLLRNGVLPADRLRDVLDQVRGELGDCGLQWRSETDSPLPGHAGNREVFWHLTRR